MGTKFQGTAAEVRALNTYIKLTRAAQSVLDRTNRHIADYGLTVSQFGVLEALLHLGTLSQSEVARKLLLSTANITTVMQNLERAGYITRERDRDDQRVVRATITDSGRSLIESIMPVHVAALVADMSVLTPAEQETLATLCRKLGRGG